MLPEFNEETMKSHGNWSKYEKEHKKRWNDGTVMYNKNSGRIITPPPEDVMSAPTIGGTSFCFWQKAGPEAGKSGQGR